VSTPRSLRTLRRCVRELRALLVEARSILEHLTPVPPCRLMQLELSARILRASGSVVVPEFPYTHHESANGR